MKVSIVIPVYNVEPYIERCVRSVARQTYRNLEVLLIDDCGTDNSISVANETIQSLTRKEIFRFITHDKNLGLSAARNTGISEVRGEYLYFLDSDDHIVEDCIEKLMEAATSHQPDFVMADHREIGKAKPTPPFELDLGFIKPNEAVIHSQLSRRLYVMAWNKLINTDFIKNNNLYFKEGIVYEDELWSFMVACKANAIYVLGDKTYMYTIRPGSIMQSTTCNHYHSRSETIVSMVSFINDNLRLTRKPLVYTYIEELKSSYFTEVLSSNATFSYKYGFYKTIRNSTYTKMSFLGKHYKFTFPQIVRNIHYILPARLGYTYYRIALKLKSGFGI